MPDENTSSPATGDAGISGDGVIDSIIASEGDSFSEPTPAAGTDDGNVQQPAGEESAPKPATAVAAQPKTEDQELERLAAEMGLDPANQRERAALEKMLQRLPSGTGTAEDAAELTPFEKQLYSDAGKPPETPTPPEPAARPPEVPVQPQVGDNWQRPEDAYQELTEAYGNGEDPADLARVVRIENAMFDRRLEYRAMPVIERAVHHWVQEMLGPVLPELQSMREKSQEAAHYNFAVQEISKTKGYEDFAKLYDKIDDTKIKFKGQEWPNNAVNQVYSRYPHLLDIRVTHDAKGNPIRDPAVAARLTNIVRLRAVANHWGEMNKTVSTAKAGEFVKAGAEQAKRQIADRTRQSLNSGPGASANGASGKSSSDEWFDEVNRSSGGISLSDLFK